jgi:dienelactone hydrolase
MDNLEKNLLGTYGAGLMGMQAKQEPTCSFLQEHWIDVSLWSKAAQKIFSDLVLEPQMKKPKVTVLQTYTYDGLSIEELQWQLPFGPPTRAWFLKPQNSHEKLPGILAFHDHGGNKYFGREKIVRTGKEIHKDILEHQAQYYGGRAWANELAKLGYGVLVHDIFAFGSRRLLAQDIPSLVVKRAIQDPMDVRELTPDDLKTDAHALDIDVSIDEPRSEIVRYNAFAGQYEAILAKSLFSLGLTWPGLVLAEDRYALDYLQSRPDIDTDRIGCGGLSGGGLRTNYLAGTDHRIRCSVTTGFMTTWADFALHTAFTHSWMIYIPSLPLHMEYPEILAMRAPLPSLVQYSRQDPLFSQSEVARTATILQDIYAKAGASQNFRMSYSDGPHRFDTTMQEEAFAWFDKWLKP